MVSLVLQEQLGLLAVKEHKVLLVQLVSLAQEDEMVHLVPLEHLVHLAHKVHLDHVEVLEHLATLEQMD